MRRGHLAGILPLALLGCSFHPTGPGPTGDDDDGSGSDAAVPIARVHRRTITIDHTRVTEGPHAAFPVLVSLDHDDDLRDHARSDGHDLHFTAADGHTPLAYEREAYDGATGHLVAWVAVPSLASDTDTAIELVYGASTSADDLAQPELVWSTSFAGAWHLDEPSGALHDSTSHHGDATASGDVRGGDTGQIGGATAFGGTNGLLRVSDSAALDETAAHGTVELWAQLPRANDGNIQTLLSSSNTFPAGAGSAMSPADGYSFAVQGDGDLYFYPWSKPNDDFDLTTRPIQDAAFHHVAVAWSFASPHAITLYVDGVARPVLAADNHENKWTQIADPADWLWGGNPSGTETAHYLTGHLDEIHVSNITRPAGWIRTSFANQSAPSAFYRVGEPEILTPL